MFIDALENESIRHDVIKEALIRLSLVIDLAKDSEKTTSSGGWVQDREGLGSRNNMGKSRVWNKDLERVKRPPKNREEEADTNRRDWSLKHGFFAPTPGRYGLVCWTYNYEGREIVRQGGGCLQEMPSSFFPKRNFHGLLSINPPLENWMQIDGCGESPSNQET